MAVAGASSGPSALRPCAVSALALRRLSLGSPIARPSLLGPPAFGRAAWGAHRWNEKAWHHRRRLAAASFAILSGAAAAITAAKVPSRGRSSFLVCEAAPQDLASQAGGGCGNAEVEKAAASVVDLVVRDYRRSQAAVASTPLVVFVHGLDSWSGTWHGAATALAARGIPSLAVDLRGHGQSPMGDPADFGPAQLAADVRAALLREGGLRQGGPGRCIVLVGHSMGGKVVMRYAADYPEDLAALVIADMDCTCREYDAGYMNPGPAELELKRGFDRAFATWEECHRSLTSFGYDAKRVDGMRTEAVPRVFPSGSGGAVWSSINPYAQWLARRTVLSQDDAYASLQRIAATRACGRADLAVHVLVAGDAGTVCSWDALPGGIRDMEAVLPGLAVAAFPKSAHSIHNSDGEAFVQSIAEVVRLSS